MLAEVGSPSLLGRGRHLLVLVGSGCSEREVGAMSRLLISRCWDGCGIGGRAGG